MSEPTHYDTLGVSCNAPDSIIKAAYRTWMKEVHPDTGTQKDSGHAAAVNEAYRVLKNPVDRHQYDAWLEAEAMADASGDEPDFEWGVEDTHWGVDDVDWGTEEEIAEPASAPLSDVVNEMDDFSQRDPSRIAGCNVFDRERINLNDMEWFTHEYGEAESASRTQRRPPSKKGVRIWAWVLFSLLGASLLVVALGVLLSGSDFVGQLSSVLNFLLVIPLISLGCGFARARARGGTKRYVAFLLVGLAFVALWFRTEFLFGFILLLWLSVYVLTVELFRISSKNRQTHKRRPVLPRSDVERFNVWGHPAGNPGPMNASLGERPSGSDATSRIMTGQLLDALAKIPGVRIVHSPTFEGPASLDVDHVVVCGNRIAVIQAQHRPGGDYYWLGHFLMHARTRQNPREIPTSFPAAVNGYRQRFPKLEVQGWYVLHSKDDGAIRVNNVDAGDRPRLVTPELLLREVGQWFASGKSPEVTNRRVLSRLVFGYR